MFHTVLVANRGEIALRVIHTLREMGIKSVAVHSEADAGAPHVTAADQAVAIGPAPARESYLSADRILDAARRTGAEAIHPGYGFLAESAGFARRCAEAGLVFVGPSPAVLEAVGDKVRARQTAESADVPIVPGTPPSDDLPALARAARELRLPVLVKAAGGGGGKGMRLIGDWKELDEALGAASREATAAFGDGRLLIERFVRPARHVEVQILGDGKGGVAAIGERECSLQRRYQKIVEEAPSPAVDEALRARMLEAARRVGAAVEYAGAGTVEFLLAPAGDFYFLEVNARLQVEHPVTELVTGLDLVRLQLEVAAGQAPDLPALERAARGHAIEARLYAEDPAAGFLPTSGPVLRLAWPQAPGIRVDAGIVEGQTVGTDYDPLLAKLVAWGPDREQARRRLVAALEETVLLGLHTNQSFLIDLLEDEAFREGRTFTTSVENAARESPGTRAEDGGDLPAAVLAAAALAFTQGIGAAADGRPGEAPGSRDRDGGSPWGMLGRWRVGAER
jgi:3-methylcrotonyl-CoA carboxylase alpha subunit